MVCEVEHIEAKWIKWRNVSKLTCSQWREHLLIGAKAQRFCRYLVKNQSDKLKFWPDDGTRWKVRDHQLYPKWSTIHHEGNIRFMIGSPSIDTPGGKLSQVSEDRQRAYHGCKHAVLWCACSLWTRGPVVRPRAGGGCHLHGHEDHLSALLQAASSLHVRHIETGGVQQRYFFKMLFWTLSKNKACVYSFSNTIQSLMGWEVFLCL